MSSLKLVELVDNKFNKFIRGKGKVDSNADLKFSQIDYFCFDPSVEFLKAYQEGGKVGVVELVNSEIFEVTNELFFKILCKKYNPSVQDYGIFQREEEKIFKKVEGKMGPDVSLNAQKEIISEFCGGSPFKASFFVEIIKAQKDFIYSNLEIHYNENIRGDVAEYKKEFLGKEFDFDKFNSYLLRQYKFF
ncbi:hypothetical protein HOD29_00880 [archaeon]|jgi:hypothetical protein|nr:hypothetical protein [archaeon]